MLKYRIATVATALASFLWVGQPGQGLQEPPLAVSPNVELLGNIPGSAAGMDFTGHYAYVTGWDGLTVLDIAAPASPTVAGFLPLPHFENEDVDLCGDTLIIVNDREARDIGAVMYVIDISARTTPSVSAVLPLGLTGEGRGSGHIANFVTQDCSLVWVDGGNLVEVVDLSNPAAPQSLGKFESEASKSDAFKVTHDTELDGQGFLWSVGGGGAAGYRLTKDPLKPRLRWTTGPAGVNPSPYNDFILHNSKRVGNVLYVTEEDYIDTSETPPGGCRGQGKFETWQIRTDGVLAPLDTWQTELNGMFTDGSADSKAPVTVNCSSHWFEVRAGVAAVGWYEQGTRFLDLTDPTNILQVGYYLPANGSTWAAYWSPTDRTGQIAYTTDVYRGIDILRLDRSRAGTPVQAPVPATWFDAVATPATYEPSSTFGWACVYRVEVA